MEAKNGGNPPDETVRTSRTQVRRYGYSDEIGGAFCTLRTELVLWELSAPQIQAEPSFRERFDFRSVKQSMTYTAGECCVDGHSVEQRGT